MSRTGGQPDWRGPRLPTAPQPIGPEDIGDPAKGEKVARCLTCGVPLQLVTGTFVPDKGERFAGRRFRYRLCVHCLEHANGPLDPDPLHVEAA
jgi:hypothetical protein